VSPAKQPGVYRCPFPPRQSLQNTQCFHNLYAYLSAARSISEPSTLLRIGRVSVATRQLITGSAIQRVAEGSARQAPGSKVANKDERAYIDVLFFLNRRTSNSASSSHQADPNRKPSLRLQSSCYLTDHLRYIARLYVFRILNRITYLLHLQFRNTSTI
jgi:hypothetical protein